MRRSSKRLREWMGLTAEDFYDAEKIALVPVGFCYPGTGRSGDLPPRPECAPEWHEALLAGMPDAAVQREVQRHIPGGRFGRPDELAAAVLFAASPEASYLNGSVVSVDAALGGREAGPV